MAVSNLGMQCWKSLLSIAPPRPGAKMTSPDTQPNSMRSRFANSHSQKELRDRDLRCICPFDHKTGILVLCYVCAKAQHARCYYPNSPKQDTSDGSSTSHQCLHCEIVRGDVQEPRIADAATVRRAGHALRTWCGDIEELSEKGELGDREHWENAGMLLSTLVRLITEMGYATRRCGEPAAVRLTYHCGVMMEAMLGISGWDGVRSTEEERDLDSGVMDTYERDWDSDVEVCPEEEFGKTAMGLVDGLVEILPGLLGE